MKNLRNLLPIAAMLTIVFLTVSCSNNDDNGSTLKVNSKSFGLGSNSGTAVYNATAFHPSSSAEDPNVRIFYILDKNSLYDEEQRYIAPSIYYPASQPSINASYPLDQGSSASTGYGMLSYYDVDTEYGTFPESSAGSVTVEDLGNSSFKLTFTGAVLHKTDTPADPDTKTVSGYVKAKFGALIGSD